MLLILKENISSLTIESLLSRLAWMNLTSILTTHSHRQWRRSSYGFDAI